MFDKVNKDLAIAMKSGDKFKLSVLRMVKSALQLESINKKGDLTDEDVIAVLKKAVKQRNDSISEYSRLNKMDVVDSLKKEIEIINEYLPEEASIEQINSVIDKAFLELNPTGMKDMGAIMKFVSANLKNADNSKVSAIVRERLNK